MRALVEHDPQAPDVAALVDAVRRYADSLPSQSAGWLAGLLYGARAWTAPATAASKNHTPTTAYAARRAPAPPPSPSPPRRSLLASATMVASRHSVGVRPRQRLICICTYLTTPTTTADVPLED